MILIDKTERKQYKSVVAMYGMYECPVCRNKIELPCKLGNTKKSCDNPSCRQEIHKQSNSKILKPSNLPIIKELGVCEQVSSTGNVKRQRMTIFLCTTCNNEFTTVRSQGILAKSCSDCADIIRSKTKLNRSEPYNLKTHGKSNTPFYSVWRSMIQRCHNEKNNNYYKYGARGIKVEDRWHKFENFMLDMEPGYLKLLQDINDGKYFEDDRPSIDRIDSLKGYNIDNTRWITLAHNSARAGWKPVEQIDIQTGDIIARYKSVREAQNHLLLNGISAREDRISSVCLGKANKHAGFKWNHCSEALEYGIFKDTNNAVPVVPSSNKKIEKTAKKTIDSVAPVVPKSIIEIDSDGNILKRYNSVQELIIDIPEARTDKVAMVCDGRRKMHIGRIFRYEDGYEKDSTNTKGTHRSIIATNIEDGTTEQYKTVREAGRALSELTGIGNADSWRNGAKRALKKDDGTYKGYAFSYS